MQYKTVQSPPQNKKADASPRMFLEKLGLQFPEFSNAYVGCRIVVIILPLGGTKLEKALRDSKINSKPKKKTC